MDVDIEEVLALDGPVSGSVPAHAAQVTNKGGAAAVHLVKKLYSLKSCFLSFETIASLLAHHMCMDEDVDQVLEKIICAP